MQREYQSEIAHQPPYEDYRDRDAPPRAYRPVRTNNLDEYRTDR